VKPRPASDARSDAKVRFAPSGIRLFVQGLFAAFLWLPGTAASLLSLTDPRQSGVAFVVLLAIFGGGLAWSIWQMTRDFADVDGATLRLSTTWGSKRVDLRPVARVERVTERFYRSTTDDAFLYDERGVEVLRIDLHDVRDRDGLVRTLRRAAGG
jgi:hypothetical protein